MDKVMIEELEVFAHHGVHPEENILGQKFLVTAVLMTNTRNAGLTGELSKTIHYGEVSRKINAFMKEHTYQLIETAAEMLAREILLYFSGVEQIELTVKKPWAPIGLPVKTVSVTITRGWHDVYLGIGSNMGTKRKYLEDAVEALKIHSDCRVLEVSDWIETKPYGVTEQDEFLNGVMKIKTLLPPEELLILLHVLEEKAGRKRTMRWGPRTLDLDILLYDDAVINTKNLTIPHPDMQNRTFVLGPMVQIAANEMHPVLKQTMTQLLSGLNNKPDRQ